MFIPESTEEGSEAVGRFGSGVFGGAVARGLGLVGRQEGARPHQVVWKHAQGVASDGLLFVSVQEFTDLGELARATVGFRHGHSTTSEPFWAKKPRLCGRNASLQITHVLGHPPIVGGRAVFAGLPCPSPCRR